MILMMTNTATEIAYVEVVGNKVDKLTPPTIVGVAVQDNSNKNTLESFGKTAWCQQYLNIL